MSDYLTAQQVELASPCIEWTGTRTQAGYGFTRGEYVHRTAYIERHGFIPEGLEIDHLCRNRACYNADHLEAVTHAENMSRAGLAVTHCPRGHRRTRPGYCRECKNDVRRATGRRVLADRCPKGHPYDDENTLTTPQGWRRCRICTAATKAAYKQRQREAVSA